MEVITAEEMGMCFGVKRAFEKADKIAELYGSNGNVYTLGELVHNSHVLAYFEGKGVRKVYSIDEIYGGKVDSIDKTCRRRMIIRAHGVPEKIKKEAKKKGIEVIDATCPRVLRLRDAARAFEHKGYQVVVYGEKNHPEVRGVAGNLREPIIVGGLQDIHGMESYDQIGLVSQTTKMPEKYAEIKKALRRLCNHLEAADTICSATQKRQESARKTAYDVDVMLVIGDMESSNSKNLLEVCKKANESSFLICSSGDLRNISLNGCQKAGVTAGASTPDWIINEVVDALKGM